MAGQTFKNAPLEGSSNTPRKSADSGANSKVGRDLENWLGGRDSNPDCTVQSRVS